jgi:putative ATPase
MSRSTLFQLESMNKEHSLIAMRRALADEDKGLGFMDLQADDEALEHIATMANGDIRRALEAKLNIAQAILFAVESPKSNAVYTAISKAMNAIDEVKSAEVPLHLRDTHYSGAVKLGHEGYQYPHNYPGHYVKQEYLPKQLSRRIFYEATEQGNESKIRLNQQRRREL